MNQRTWGTGLLVVLSGLLVLATSGCSWLHPDPNAGTLAGNDRMDRGIVIVLPGIEGKSYLNKQIRDGLADGGVTTGILIRDWTLGKALALVSEMWEGRARDQAADLAQYIHGYRLLHPTAPVMLVAHSGGCAVAVFTLERLPVGANVDAAVLLAPSLSTDYDLSAALRHVDGTVYSYYSNRDVALLGVGTFIFGTVDRSHSAAAGNKGFTVPRQSADLYAHKLKQIPWDPEMVMAQNSGGHTDWANQLFVREYVAPKILAEIAAHVERAKPKPLSPPQPVTSRPADHVIIYHPPVSGSTVTPPASGKTATPPPTLPIYSGPDPARVYVPPAGSWVRSPATQPQPAGTSKY